MKLLDEAGRDAIEAHLAGVIDQRICSAGLDAFGAAVRTYVMAGGKRIRPQLAAWTFRHASGDPTLTKPLLDIAAAWELFHAFLLVHDDIIDDACTRHDQRALHVALASLDAESARFGTNLGIVAGDLLHSAAMAVWHDLDVPHAMHRDLLRLFSRVGLTTGFGQVIDICISHTPMDQVDLETLLREYHWKTAAYTFEGPMLSGAILAGLDAAALAAISTFALSIGQAYQLQNDLLDLSVPAHDGCDLVQGKRTVTLLQHRLSLDTSQRGAFDARLTLIASGCTDAVTNAEAVRQDLLQSGVMTRSTCIIRELLELARSAVSDPSLSPRLAKELESLLAAMTKSYFVEA